MTQYCFAFESNVLQTFGGTITYEYQSRFCIPFSFATMGVTKSEWLYSSFGATRTRIWPEWQLHSSKG